MEAIWGLAQLIVKFYEGLGTWKDVLSPEGSIAPKKGQICFFISSTSLIVHGDLNHISVSF